MHRFVMMCSKEEEEEKMCSIQHRSLLFYLQQRTATMDSSFFLRLHESERVCVCVYFDVLRCSPGRNNKIDVFCGTNIFLKHFKQPKHTSYKSNSNPQPTRRTKEEEKEEQFSQNPFSQRTNCCHLENHQGSHTCNGATCILMGRWVH